MSLEPRNSVMAVILALCALVPVGAFAAQSEAGQEQQLWNLGTQQTGKVLPTTVSAFNKSCSGKRDFQITVLGQAARFLRITGPTLLERIKRGQTKTTDAVLDLRGIEPGVYNEGTIEVRCLNCLPPCSQDYQVLLIHLTVEGPAVASEEGTATTGGTDTGTTDGVGSGEGDTTGTSVPPPTIELVEPADGATITTPQPTFEWTMETGYDLGIGYSLKITPIPDGKTPAEAIEEEEPVLMVGTWSTKIDPYLYGLDPGAYAWQVEVLEVEPADLEEVEPPSMELVEAEPTTYTSIRFTASKTRSFDLGSSIAYDYGSLTADEQGEEDDDKGDDPRDTPPPSIYGEEICSVSDLAGRFQPAQGVWQDDPVFVDKPGKQLVQSTPTSFRAELPMILGRKTALFGTIRPVGGEPEEKRDWIFMRGKAGGVPVPVKYRFTLKQAGSSRVIATTPIIGVAPIGGPCTGASTEFEVKLEAKNGIPRFGPGFTFATAGEYILEAELLRGDGRQTGMKVSVLGKVVETSGPTIAFRPVVLAKGAVDVVKMVRAAREVAAESSKKIPDFFPVPSSPLTVSTGPVRDMRRFIAGSLTELAIFKSDRSAAIVANVDRRMGAGGVMTNADRVVVLMGKADLDLLFEKAAGFAASKRVVYAKLTPGAVYTVAHELVHTLPYLWSATRMQAQCDRDYHNKDDKIAHGHRVTWDLDDVRRREADKEPIMGPESFGWTTQCTYWQLTDSLRGGPPDPPVILVQGYVSRRPGVPQGRLEALYQFDSFVDLEPGEGGPWAIVLADAAGGELARFPFAPEWRLPDLEIERDLMSFVYRLPDLPGVAQVSLVGPDGEADTRRYSESPPELRITSPATGATAKPRNGAVTVRWAASDADGESLLSTVLYSADGGESWIDLAFEIEGSSFDAVVDERSRAHLVMVRVTDGARSSDSTVEFSTP